MTEEASPFTDEVLATRCLAGDQWAWGVIVRRHSRLVFSLARRSVGRHHEAEDVTQDIFLKVSRMLHRYDAQSAFKPWLLQVARNHLIDHHRSRRREKEATLELDAMVVEPVSTAPGQANELLRKQRADAVRRAVEQLSPKLREAVLLRDVEGLEYEDIAAAIGQPLGTVKSRLNRGRLQLAEMLRGLEGDLA